MALITCPECGQQVSDRAKACPHCGFDMTAPKCPDCGEYLAEGADACPKCGYQVEAAAPAPAPVPAAAPASKAAAKPGVAILELPGPHPKMKTAEEWVVADEKCRVVKQKVLWGADRVLELPLETPEVVWLIPKAQMQERRKKWWGNKFGVIVAMIVAYGVLESTVGDSSVGSVVNLFGALGLIGYLIILFLHRRSKHLRLIITPGKRYSLIWKNRHTFSVSEYDA